ncbi:hypothetical protein O3G_MSEX000969 [Manduca sexta]|nr:hypothetical protein O3G_MSEX000969 [Manduca sexta]
MGLDCSVVSAVSPASSPSARRALVLVDFPWLLRVLARLRSHATTTKTALSLCPTSPPHLESTRSPSGSERSISRGHRSWPR